MPDKQSTKPPAGTRDFLPEDVRKREYVIGVIRNVYEKYGFEPLETPAFENIETLLGKYGEEGNKLIFKILKRGEHEHTGEADLALRYDLTVPLARVVAQYQEKLPKLFKRYQIQPVWRADRPARGRFREFYQCDIDAIGSTSSMIEAEILSAVSEILTTIGFSDFTIRLNDRRVLAAMLETADVDRSQHSDVLVALDKLDKIGVDGFEKELSTRGIPAGVTAALLRFFGSEEQRGGVSVADALATYLGQHESGAKALEHLETVKELAERTAARDRLRIDPSLARGLSYYTGAIMEIAVEGIGSLGGGGRYDNLIGMFLGRDVPACGFSLGLERILVVMTERNMFPAEVVKGGVDIVVTFMDDGARAEALKLAGELRHAQHRVDIFPEATRKFEKPLKYASERGARVMAIFGENEVTRGEASIRDLTTREQQAVPREQAVSTITRLLNPGTVEP